VAVQKILSVMLPPIVRFHVSLFSFFFIDFFFEKKLY
jgi:hypothetical protein